MAGQEVYVLGGANSAGQAALHLARYARRLTLVVRAPSLEAGMSHYLVRQLAATPNVDVRVGTEIVGGGGDGWLTHLVLRDRASGAEETVDADGLYPSIGARPHTDWLPRRSPGTTVASCSRVGTSPETAPGRSSGTRSRSRRPCRASSRSAMRGTAR